MEDDFESFLFKEKIFNEKLSSGSVTAEEKMSDFDMSWGRTHFCGALRERATEVILNGWVRGLREHSHQLFVDLWDDSGIVQLVISSEAREIPNDGQNYTEVLREKKIHYGDVIAVKGDVRERPQGMKNSNMATGGIEVAVKEFLVFSPSETPPFRAGDKVNEESALKYRYLDLRYRKKLRDSLKSRHQVMQIVRDYLSKEKFYEIETPILYKNTPEGARDYLVPSRIHKGQFYALPQSPQTLKQILMVAGMEKYFQICHCFRDEDLRADRQPEFSQIDMEMSFTDEEEIQRITEGLIRRIWSEIKGENVGDIPTLSYEEALKNFGTDKPDLRNSLRLKTLSQESLEKSGIPLFEEAGLQEGTEVKALFVPELQISGSRLKRLSELARSEGCSGLLWIVSNEEGFKTPFIKWTSAEKVKTLFHEAGGEGKGICFFGYGESDSLNKHLASLISNFGEEKNLIKKDKTAFVWITDFPLLEFDPQKKHWSARHHPFTSPQRESIEFISKEKDMSLIKARAYDLVCNGRELAGGSIRNHSLDLQKKIFSILGLKEEEVQNRFGFFLEALSYGCPPHGGIAWGLERLMMLLMGTENIREVMAFPKSTNGSCLMSGAPSEAEAEHLAELQK